VLVVASSSRVSLTVSAGTATAAPVTSTSPTATAVATGSELSEEPGSEIALSCVLERIEGSFLRILGMNEAMLVAGGVACFAKSVFVCFVQQKIVCFGLFCFSTKAQHREVQPQKPLGTNFGASRAPMSCNPVHMLRGVLIVCAVVLHRCFVVVQGFAPLGAGCSRLSGRQSLSSTRLGSTASYLDSLQTTQKADAFFTSTSSYLDSLQTARTTPESLKREAQEPQVQTLEPTAEEPLAQTKQSVLVLGWFFASPRELKVRYQIAACQRICCQWLRSQL
jgi:hypothetical protein